MTRKKIGQLFIVAGSPTHAADVFRDILRRHPQDSDAHAGLGEAEFAEKNYQAAQADFLTASRLNPQNDPIRKRLDLCSQVLALDPTRRGLDPAERYRRSRKLLDISLDEATRCAANAPDLLDEAPQNRYKRARCQRPAKVKPWI